MKLLFDQNLSPKLVRRLADLFPEAIHVHTVGLGQSLDNDVWEYAHANDCMIVTKDADFDAMSLLRGTPPKVLWLRIGNCTVGQVEQLFRDHVEAIQSFAEDPVTSVLVVL